MAKKQITGHIIKENYDYVVNYQKTEGLHSFSQALDLLINEAKIAIEIKEIRYDAEKIIQR